MEDEIQGSNFVGTVFSLNGTTNRFPTAFNGSESNKNYTLLETMLDFTLETELTELKDDQLVTIKFAHSYAV